MILPTHHCFDDALDLIVAWVQAAPARAGGLRLVHGIMLADDGRPYAHAWLEDECQQCWDSGVVDGVQIAYAVDAAEFLRERRVIAATRYSLREALTENHRSGHYGPWRPEYRALCGRSGEVLGRIAATYEPARG